MPQKPTTFQAPLARQNRMLAYYLQQMQQQQKLLRIVRAVLPSAWADKISYCLIKDKKLSIYTTSAAWASQLRFYDKIIRAQVGQERQQPIDTLQIKLLIETIGVTQSAALKARIPSASAIGQIRDNSLRVADPQLQQALLKLSATLARLSGNR